MIPIFSNTLGDEELQAVERVFASRWLGRGQECAGFESEFAAYQKTDASQVLLCNCCTSAIYIALRALGVGPGAEVIVPTAHFVSAGTLPMELGAQVVLADVDARTLNVKPAEVERLLTKRTRAILLLHYGGHPCDVDAIREIVDGRAAIIEDAANAVASTYHGLPCGTLADAGVWSFDAMKILVMGDGGALWMRDDVALKAARSMRYLGLKRGTASGTDAAHAGSPRWWEFTVETPSGRFISNDILAAIGRVQLKKLDQFISRRHEIWDTYQRELASCPLALPPEPLADCTTSYYMYWVQTSRRDDLAAFLREQGIFYTTFRYWPLHRAIPGFDGEFPGADEAADTTLCLPLHQNLTDADVEEIIGCVKDFFR